MSLAMAKDEPTGIRRYECLRCSAHTVSRAEDDSIPRCSVCGSISMRLVQEREPPTKLRKRRAEPPR